MIHSIIITPMNEIMRNKTCPMKRELVPGHEEGTP